MDIANRKGISIIQQIISSSNHHIIPFNNTTTTTSSSSLVPFSTTSSVFSSLFSSITPYYLPSSTMTTSTDTLRFNREIPMEVLIVDQDISKDLQCGICLQLLHKPRQCKNGHLFCQECIERALLKNLECPSCRCSLSIVELCRSLFVERHLRQLKVYCSNRYVEIKGGGGGESTYEIDNSGCNEICTMESLVTHESLCGYTRVQCKYSATCGKYRKHEIEQHSIICPFRPVCCCFCKVAIRVDDISQHEEVCMKAPVKCSKCSVSILRGELAAHEKETCEMSTISCPFKDSGCSSLMLRRDLKEHISTTATEHLIMMKSGFDSQLKALSSELKIKDEKIQALEKARDAKKHDAKVIWKVENYSVARKKNYLQSEKFQFAGFPWFLGFYTDGDNDESRGFISIYLFLDEKYTPKNKSVSIEFTIRFVNHRDPSSSVKKDFKITFPVVSPDSNKRKSGWGDRRAMKNSHIDSKAGFIEDDALQVELEVTLKHTQWFL